MNENFVNFLLIFEGGFVKLVDGDKMSIHIVVCTDANGGIGYKNRMPWHHPQELAHFKKLTYGHTVVYGRKTYESIGGILEGRRNVIVSRHPNPQVEVVSNFECFLESHREEELYICGGGEIYRQALNYADWIERSLLKESYTCDTFFYIPKTFECVSRENHGSFIFEVYRRKKDE